MSYFLFHLNSQLRTVGSCRGFEGVPPGDDDSNDEEHDGNVDEDDVNTPLTEDTEPFVASLLCCFDKDPLDFKSFWNQPKGNKKILRSICFSF